MIRRLGHPSFGELSRYVDHEIDGPRRTRLVAHLSGCVRCRETVCFIRELGVAARELPVPGPARDALNRILERRAAGERVILPVADPGIPARRWRPGIAAAAAVILAVTLVVAITAPRLEADRSWLRFSDERPAAGETITVEYGGGALFEHDDRLVLRARYRFAGGGQRSLEAATLTRDGDVFRGTLRLPDSLAYAVYSVEDPTGARVDANTRRLWELVVHDRSGRPTLAALRERSDDLVGRNWELAHRTAREMTGRFPDEPESWYRLYFFDRHLLGARARDSLDAAHRARLAALERRLEATTPSADRMAALSLYAAALGETDIRRRWETRLREAAPGHPIAVQARVAELVEGSDAEPARVLAELESLWRTYHARPRVLVDEGYNAALEAGDAAAAIRWADRISAVIPASAGMMAILLSREPGLADAGISRMAAELDRLDAPVADDRAPGRTVEEDRLLRAAAARRLRAALGAALVRKGESRAGLDALLGAVDEGWDPGVFRAAGESLLAAGDTAAALDVLARVAIDPATEPGAADPIHALGAARLGLEVWEHRTADAREEMRRRLLERAVRRPIGTDLALLDLDGAPHELAELLGGRVGVVVFWSRDCAPAIHELAALERTALDLEAIGARLLVVSPEAPSAELRRFLAERGVSFPVYSDPDGEAKRRFNQWSTPERFVLDAGGVIRFEYVEGRELTRLAMALLPAGAGAPMAVE